MASTYDFAGWATKNDLKCTDGRTIRRDAFKAQDGEKVPLCWGHKHDDVFHVLGHAYLKNEPDGVRAYCKFNNTEQGQAAKEVVRNGDVDSLSIYAGHLKHNGADVVHGKIVEVSLVLAGANPGAKIEDVFAHGDYVEDEGIVYTGLPIDLPDEEPVANVSHADEPKQEEPTKEDKPMSETKKDPTIEEVIESMTEEQRTVMEAVVGAAIADTKAELEEEEDEVKHNFFDENTQDAAVTLSHADEEEIIKLAKNSSVGTLQNAIELYAQNNETLQHGFSSEDIQALFPEYKDVRPGAPELITRDQDWVNAVMNKVHKTPISRIRTRQMDIRDVQANQNLNGRGYNRSKRSGEKVNMGNAKLVSRTHDPQTVYIKDSLHRDDIIDITDFDVVQYEYSIMRTLLKETLALAIMIGDGRDDSDADKIHPEHIRDIWHDDDLYTIHATVDVEAMRTELQGTDTDAHFGENYIYAEAVIQQALYAREQYKGSGQLDFFCEPHLLNVMLLARDFNGRRIYSDVSDLAKALNVKNIYTAEQFAGKTRTVGEGASAKTMKLLGLFVDLDDFHLGATKGGEITSFNQFDIDFNLQKYLLETRLSGANTRIYSAIALEEEVVESNP